MEYTDLTRGPYSVTADGRRIDVDAVHGFLTRCFWARGISKDLVAKSIAHSLCFGLFDDRAQIGFARVVTDSSTYAYLCDVYVLEQYRGKGLGKWMMEFVMAHPDLQGLRRFQLVTRDAHGLYRRHGFKTPANPEGYMEIFRSGMYSAESNPEDF
jgi:ribosomal protein S18 acetylase RimI-like enzyme